MNLFDALRHISARDAAERAGLILHQRGGKWWTCCPLHGEKTASMAFYEGDRGWTCFGCHRGGDAVRLYAELFHLQPLEAAKALAAAFGISTDERAGPIPKPTPTVFNLRRALERFRAERLAALREARRLADGVCRCRATINGPEAWNDQNFVGALSARAAADIETDRLEGATLDELALRMEGRI